MPQVFNLQKLNEVFFPSEYNYYPKEKNFRVSGNPYFNNDIEMYGTYKKVNTFRTYKESVFAGLIWTKKLFECNFNELTVKTCNWGVKKSKIEIEIVNTTYPIILDGEVFYPYIVITYSYETITKVKFDIGFYRSACSNGVIYGQNEIIKLDISTNKLFEVPFWINKCLMNHVSKRFENQIKILKNTEVSHRDITNFIHSNKLSNWGVNFTDLTRQYIETLGENAYALFNILTDAATNFRENLNSLEKRVGYTEIYITDSFDSNEKLSEIYIRQRRVGIFLENLIDDILNQNKNENEIDINDPNFQLNFENLNAVEQQNVILDKYYYSLDRIKF